MTVSDSVKKPVCCPRCGYDQRGVVATWHDSCPLQGTCSECGLPFNWPEVIVPEKFEPQWCVEFAPRKRSIPAAAAKTFAKSFWPRTFWSHLKMSQPVRRVRLIAYCLLLLFPFVATYVIGQSIIASHRYSLVQRQMAAWPQQIARSIALNQESLLALQTAQQLATMTEDEREAALDALPATIAYSTEQFRNMVEGFRPWSSEQMTQHIQLRQRWIAGLQPQTNAAPVVNHTRLAAIWEMLANPLSRTSSGFIQFADGTVQPYPGPYEVYGWIAMTATGTGFSLLTEERALQALGGLLAGLLLTCLLPATFVLLPASRRRAKVRWWHVFRIFVYSLFAIETLALVLIGAGLVQLIANSALAMWIARQAPILFWIALPTWWAVAIKRYLKMPHAWAVAGLMTLMLVLLMSPLLAMVLPEWMVGLVLD